MQLIKQIKLDYEFDPLLQMIPVEGLPERTLGMKLTNASAGSALDLICKNIGIGWWAEKPDDHIMLHFVRLKTTMTQMDMLEKLGVNINAITAQAMASVNIASEGRRIPEGKKVKLSGEARDIKVILEDVLKQAGLTFSFDSDLPMISKQIAFENIRIDTALDVICATAEIGWKLDHVDDKIVIRIGKSYAKPGEE
jgi:hypothetical protein